jgi:uncharacterized protein with PIN domain
MKILCDQMLGSLAKWLRIAGFDTFYANNEMTDEELLHIAVKEKRILITRDKELITKSKKLTLNVIEITTTDLDRQLQQVLSIININKKLILTRCSLCNNILKTIDKKEVKNRVPKNVFENKDKFWFCNNCDKFYWNGSHHEKIMKKIDEITKT